MRQSDFDRLVERVAQRVAEILMPEIIQCGGESIAGALIASSASCASANKDQEVFLTNTVQGLFELAPHCAHPYAGKILEGAALLVAATEPPPPMCPREAAHH